MKEKQELLMVELLSIIDFQPLIVKKTRFAEVSRELSTKLLILG